MRCRSTRSPGPRWRRTGGFAGVLASQLAAFPGTTDFFGLSRTAMVLGAVTTFLDSAAPSEE